MQHFIQRNRFLISFSVLSTLMGTSVGIAKVTTSLYALELHADALVLGLIAAAQSIGSLLISLPVGVLVDRIGPARPFVFGSFVAGLMYFFVPAFASAWWLLACTAAISMFMPMRFVSLNSLFMREIVKIGMSKAGFYRATHMIGMMLLGPTLGVWASRAFGFDGSYYWIAGLFALTIVLSPIVLARQGERAAARSGEPLRAQLLALSADTELRETGLVEFALQSINAFFTFFIVIIAVRELALGETFASQLLALQGGAFMLSLFCLGPLASRLGDDRTYELAFGVIAVSLLALGSSSSALGLGVGSALLGAGLGSLQIVNLTRFAIIGGRLGRGKVSGLTPLLGTTGSLLGSFLGGAIGRTFGLQYVFLVYAAAFVALLAHARGRSQERIQHGLSERLPNRSHGIRP
ncbi:MAG TPA: MFS transporter [Polyangiales bacterium]|nr:MFS transporter [Polyangiales bacterium]